MSAIFAPLPHRAIGDKRLSGIHYRVLAAVAYHDRLSRGRKNGREGQGCWASHTKLAQECGINYNNLSTTLRDLCGWGYLERERHPLNKRLRVYRVRYESADTSPNDEGYSSSNDDECPEPEDPTLRRSTKNDAEIVRRDFEKRTQNQSDIHLNIFRETGNRLRKSVEKDSAEAAPPAGGGACEDARTGNLGGFLANMERKLRRGELLDVELDTLAVQLEQIASDGSRGDPNTHHASRLAELVFERQAARHGGAR